MANLIQIIKNVIGGKEEKEVCSKQYQKKYRKYNKLHLQDYKKNYDKDHKENNNEYMKNYYDTHPEYREKLKQKSRDRYAKLKGLYEKQQVK